MWAGRLFPFRLECGDLYRGDRLSNRGAFGERHPLARAAGLRSAHSGRWSRLSDGLSRTARRPQRNRLTGAKSCHDG